MIKGGWPLSRGLSHITLKNLDFSSERGPNTGRQLPCLRLGFSATEDAGCQQTSKHAITIYHSFYHEINIVVFRERERARELIDYSLMRRDVELLLNRQTIEH